MSDEWVWAYDPDRDHVAEGLPPHVIAEVESLADQLVVLGRDALHAGDGRADGGGLRTLLIFGGRGFFMFLPHEPTRQIAIPRIAWPG